MQRNAMQRIEHDLTTGLTTVIEMSDAEIAEVRSRRPLVNASDVKDEARRRIVERYPDWKQANLTARAVELVKNRVINGSWTHQENAEVAAIESAWAWIKAVRSASDLIEAQNPIQDDFQEDARWPA